MVVLGVVPKNLICRSRYGVTGNTRAGSRDRKGGYIALCFVLYEGGSTSARSLLHFEMPGSNIAGQE